jgi:hypothetical protein
VFVAEQRRLDVVHLDALALPDTLVRPLSRALSRLLGEVGPREPAAAVPAPVLVGQLGTHLRTDRPHSARRVDGGGPDSEVA